jgi:hypothetical protein
MFRREKALSFPNWRRKLVRAALVVAVCATLLNIVWNASWLYCGGSPHGMRAGPGIWQQLGRPLFWTFAIASALGFFGKGKGRILLLAWSGSMYFVLQAIYLLQFD